MVASTPGYKCFAPLGLQILRHAVATDITLRWGYYRYYATLGLQILHHAVAEEKVNLL